MSNRPSKFPLDSVLRLPSDDDNDVLRWYWACTLLALAIAIAAVAYALTMS